MGLEDETVAAICTRQKFATCGESSEVGVESKNGGHGKKLRREMDIRHSRPLPLSHPGGPAEGELRDYVTFA